MFQDDMNAMRRGILEVTVPNWRRRRKRMLKIQTEAKANTRDLRRRIF